MKKHLKKNFKKYVAEFVGTFILCLAASLSLTTASFPLSTPVAGAMALGLGVYTLGALSGAHFNPAITLGMAAVKKITGRKIAFYLLAQFLGAALAVLFLREFLDGNLAAVAPVGNHMDIIIAEAVGAFVFAMGVAAVSDGKVSQGASGLAVGGSLLLGIALAIGLHSNGIVNPAVALAIGSFSFSYLLGPVIGAAAAMWVYRYVNKG